MTLTDIHTSLTTSLETMGSDTLIVGIAIVACVVSLLALFRSHQQSCKLSKQVQRLEHDLKIASSSAIGMGQQLILLEKQLKLPSAKQAVETVTRVQEAESITSKTTPITTFVDDNKPQTSDSTSVYDRARQLLQQQQDINKVAKECGLSYAEVSLLNALGKQAVTTR